MSKISVHPAVVAVADADLLPVVQGGTNKQATAAQVRRRQTSILDANQTSSSTTPASTALSVALEAGRIYAFRVVMFVAESVAADGYRVDFDGGTATATALRVMGTMISEGSGLLGTLGGGKSTLAADHTFTIGSSFDDAIVFEGVIEVLAAGTLIPRFGQEAHSTGTATLYALSYMVVDDITP